MHAPRALIPFIRPIESYPEAPKSMAANATILLPRPIRTAEHKKFNLQLQGLYREV